jgi:hypothetical protein
MPVPAIIDGGVLPEGIHDASLDEVRSMFASSGERARLLDRFNQFLQRLGEFTPETQVTLYLDGSFITTWEGCCDIDVIIEARDFEGVKSDYLRMLVSQRVKREFLDLYKVKLRVVVPGLVNARDYRQWYQNVKGEEAWRFGNEINALRKGIVRLTP